MPEYLAPGVFIEEIERGPKPIEGVATSTVAFLGECERGPLRPRLVTGYGEFLRLFGDVFADDKYLPFGVKAFFDNGGRRCYISRIVGDGAATAELDDSGYTIRANGPGAAGNRIWARVLPATTIAVPPGGSAPEPIGFRLQLAYFGREVPGGIFDPFADVDRLPRPVLVEDYDDLSLDPESSVFWEKMIGETTSALITLEVAPGTAVPPGPDPVVSAPLAGGADGADATLAHFNGLTDEAGNPIVDPTDFRGLAALDLDFYRDVAIVHAPGIGNVDAGQFAIQEAIVTHCERNRFRFAVLDSSRGQNDISTIEPRNQRATQYGAFYYPWYHTPHPRTGVKTLVPPGAAACGIYALTDNTRGVWKAPANVPVAGAIDLEYDINTGSQEVLNPRGVNCIRRFPGRGIRMWGARTLAADPLWKYVSVRRLFIFLEASIYNSTQWVVFEPNDPKLWARVKQSVTLFLRTQWREGALFGTKEEEAFSVSVGFDTMTEDDILNGRLIVEIGIAPVRPAEFVIFRIFQKTIEAKT
ncbi:Putative prophage major tail sheath protein [Defluviimonas aquaemixtae]|uniref:Prophage major tail sheath protein n=1 Tax=Albidovulum aquaemixtae TaxID=1542388 RepID=A0A2R8BKL5_9RHOB|nr:phage tail sheath family protein [Defluviimonas aquaemixtae]SPH23940.1 Putative prophage major tail sheath protein [Defluviimonas aquaemixtae]